MTTKILIALLSLSGTTAFAESMNCTNPALKIANCNLIEINQGSNGSYNPPFANEAILCNDSISSDQVDFIYRSTDLPISKQTFHSSEIGFLSISPTAEIIELQINRRDGKMTLMQTLFGKKYTLIYSCLYLD